MLGTACMEALADGHDPVGVDLPDGDLVVPADVDRLCDAHRPDWIVHAAAYTDVDGAESDRRRALDVNAGATRNLAEACAARDIGLTCVSTDYVFPGDRPEGYPEDAPRRPVNYYGRTKALGEEAVEAVAERSDLRWQILRTSWLFGPGSRNFVLTIRRLLSEGRDLRVVQDQRGCPTYAPDLARIIRHLLESGRPGIYHGTNAGICTWHAFAAEIARLMGVDPDRVAPCGSDEYPTAAARPAHSVLLSRNLEKTGCPDRRAWQQALAVYIAWLAESDDNG